MRMMMKNDTLGQGNNRYSIERTNVSSQRIAALITKCLIDKGLAEKRSVIKKRNYIDASKFDISDEWRNKLFEVAPEEENNWMLFIPPFEHGTLQAMDGWHMVWDIEKLDLEEKYFDISFSNYKQSDGCWYTMGKWKERFRVVTPENEDDFNVSVAADMVWSNDLLKDVTRLTEEEFMQYSDPLWTSEYKDFYKKRREIAQIMIGTDKRSFKEGSNAASGAFISVIFLINCMLSLNKNRMSTKRNAGNKTASLTAEHEPEDKRKLRTLNGVSILSEKAPRAHTEQSIRKYTCASWVVRGHSRKTKTGKVVYVKEHTNKRKNMNVSVMNNAILKIV